MHKDQDAGKSILDNVVDFYWLSYTVSFRLKAKLSQSLRDRASYGENYETAKIKQTVISLKRLFQPFSTKLYSYKSPCDR